MPSTDTEAAAIRSLIDAWARAIEAKDLDGITSRYTPETVLFDAIPPHRTIGAAAIRAAWAGCLPYFPDRFTTDLHDVVVAVSGDVAWAHFLMHFTSTPPGHPCGQTWMRATTAYRREHGRWVVAHEHVSIPFNPMTNQAWFIADPAVTEVPDYTQMPGCGGGQGDVR